MEGDVMDRNQVFGMRKCKGILVSALIGVSVTFGQLVVTADQVESSEVTTVIETSSEALGSEFSDGSSYYSQANSVEDIATEETQTIQDNIAPETSVSSDEAVTVASLDGEFDAPAPDIQTNSNNLNPVAPVTTSEELPDTALPLRQTDVTESTATTTMATIDGSFLSVDPDALLTRINAIRQEAFDEGLVDTYVPLRWSYDLEQIAQIRAAEATFKQSHTRPNDSYTFTTTVNDLQASGENLAWNFRRTESSTHRATEQFYEEKPDFLTYLETGSAPDQIGHYITLINPYFQYVGIATFYTDSGHFFTTTAQEFATESELSEAQTYLSGKFRQSVEVSASNTVDVSLNLSASTLEVGQEANAILTGSLLVSGFQSGAIPTSFTDLAWSSSNPSVVSISDNGQFFGKSAGQARISVNLAGVTYSEEVTVRAITQIAALEQEVQSLDQVILPETVTAIWSDGVFSQENVIWETVVTSAQNGKMLIVGHLTEHQTDLQALIYLSKKAQSKMFDRPKTLELVNVHDSSLKASHYITFAEVNKVFDVIAVYQLKNPNTGEIFYTTNKTEKEILESIGWEYQGIAWYAPTEGQAVYRLYSKELGYHYYTSSVDEVEELKKQGWKFENIAWYQ